MPLVHRLIDTASPQENDISDVSGILLIHYVHITISTGLTKMLLQGTVHGG